MIVAVAAYRSANRTVCSARYYVSRRYVENQKLVA